MTEENDEGAKQFETYTQRVATQKLVPEEKSSVGSKITGCLVTLILVPLLLVGACFAVVYVR